MRCIFDRVGQYQNMFRIRSKAYTEDVAQVNVSVNPICDSIIISLTCFFCWKRCTVCRNIRYSLENMLSKSHQHIKPQHLFSD